MTNVAPVSASNQQLSVKQTILNLISKQPEKSDLSRMLTKNQRPWMGPFYSSVLPQDVYEVTKDASGDMVCTVRNVEPQVYKEKKFLDMFKSCEPPVDGKTVVGATTSADSAATSATSSMANTAKDVAEKGFWNSIKKHPFISTMCVLLAVGGGYYAYKMHNNKKEDEQLDKAA